AVDVACHDLAGKALGVPVWKLLGGRQRDGIEVTHSLGIMEIDRCIAEAEQAVGEGIRTIKCKTGLDPKRDVELVRQLRETVGPEVKIRVDGNEGYRTVAQAVETTRRQEEYDLLLCEQPVAGAEALAAVAVAELPSVGQVTKPAGAAGPEIAGIYYTDDVVTEPFRFEDGRVLCPDGPGLGVEVDTDKLAQYAV